MAVEPGCVVVCEVEGLDDAFAYPDHGSEEEELGGSDVSGEVQEYVGQMLCVVASVDSAGEGVGFGWEVVWVVVEELSPVVA